MSICDHSSTKVVSTSKVDDFFIFQRRYRRCKVCRQAFVTVEIEEKEYNVLKEK